MLAARCPLPTARVPLTYKRRKSSNVCKSYYTSDENNTTLLSESESDKLLHVISFHKDGEEDGIYAVRKLDNDGLPVNIIVAFETFDDAFRYKTLLEAEMDYKPYIQFATRFEINYVCNIGNYKCRVVKEGVLVTPPTETMKITDWEIRSALIDGRWSVQEKDGN